MLVIHQEDARVQGQLLRQHRESDNGNGRNRPSHANCGFARPFEHALTESLRSAELRLLGLVALDGPPCLAQRYDSDQCIFTFMIASPIRWYIPRTVDLLPA